MTHIKSQVTDTRYDENSYYESTSKGFSVQKKSNFYYRLDNSDLFKLLC